MHYPEEIDIGSVATTEDCHTSTSSSDVIYHILHTSQPRCTASKPPVTVRMLPSLPVHHIECCPCLQSFVWSPFHSSHSPHSRSLFFQCTIVSSIRRHSPSAAKDHDDFDVDDDAVGPIETRPHRPSRFRRQMSATIRRPFVLIGNISTSRFYRWHRELPPTRRGARASNPQPHTQRLHSPLSRNRCRPQTTDHVRSLYLLYIT